jgi:hypothetical protein
MNSTDFAKFLQNREFMPIAQGNKTRAAIQVSEAKTGCHLAFFRHCGLAISVTDSRYCPAYWQLITSMALLKRCQVPKEMPTVLYGLCCVLMLLGASVVEAELDVSDYRGWVIAVFSGVTIRGY